MGVLLWILSELSSLEAEQKKVVRKLDLPFAHLR
jgi:hypothetical protein